MSWTLQLAELDVPRCTREYGQAPCGAVLGVNGADYCHKTADTCQDPQAFASETQTVRWVMNTGHIPHLQLDAVPSLRSIDNSPQIIQPGNSLGKRERVQCRFDNHPHNDHGFDPYLKLRNYNAWDRGSFWGRFNARHPNISGYPFRTLHGDYDPFSDVPPLDQLEVNHYIVDRGTLLGSGGGFQIDALDVLSFVEGNRALCPRPSNGVLAAAIGTGTATVDLLPAGIGATYPMFGEGSIGKENVNFTCAGDTITLTARGQRGSIAEAHDAGDTLQVCAVISGTVSDILAELLTYTDTPADYYDIPAWDLEAAQHASVQLEGRIGTPTEVNKLVAELMQDIGLNIYTDIVARKIAMEVLRVMTPSFRITDDNAVDIEGAFDYSQLTSAVYMRYGPNNPLEKPDDGKNYAGHLLRVNDDPLFAISNNAPAIRTQNCRWIPKYLRQIADETARLYLGRYGRVLRSFSCRMPPELAPRLGRVGEVVSRCFEDASGAAPTVVMQVVRVEKSATAALIDLQEYRANYVRPNDGIRRVDLPEDELNINLRALYNKTWGAAIPQGAVIQFLGVPVELLQ